MTNPETGPAHEYPLAVARLIVIPAAAAGDYTELPVMLKQTVWASPGEAYNWIIRWLPAIDFPAGVDLDSKIYGEFMGGRTTVTISTDAAGRPVMTHRMDVDLVGRTRIDPPAEIAAERRRLNGHRVRAAALAAQEARRLQAIADEEARAAHAQAVRDAAQQRAWARVDAMIPAGEHRDRAVAKTAA